ncbi:MAG: Mut7-C ubiquitin/RNAse domain-containing protein [Bacteroidales bacterium]|nr:Mut7-C ubiquitin/RNAse domain-containing protein [Bacteroidales bacterium]
MPVNISLRFYEELNDFLHYSRQKKTFYFSFSGRRSVKDIIESIGVPHTEVDLILANNQPVAFDYHPEAGDIISVYPVFESIDISSINLLRPEPLREPKFILDVHLGTLARYLRMLGFDTLYRNDYQDDELISISLSERRALLTRDLPLLKNGRLTHGYFIRETQPKRQVQEVMRRFDLKNQIKPFARCMLCNGIIETVEKKEIEDQLLTNTCKAFYEFFQCSACGKIYWKGSHYKKMVQTFFP